VTQFADPAVRRCGYYLVADYTGCGRPVVQELHLGKRFGGLHAVIPDPFETFGHRVLHHPTNKRGDIHRFVLDALGAMGPVMVRHLVAIV
jgi:hypothetical protein